MKNVGKTERKILIILCFALIFILAMSVILNLMDKPEKEENVMDLDVLALNDENRFLTITSAIESYVSNVKYEDVDNLMIILDKKYVAENSINSSNVLYLIDRYSENQIVDVREIYQIKKYNNIYIYYVKAKLVEENFDSFMQNYIKNIYFKVTINENTLAFSIAPIDTDEYVSKVGDYKNE